MLVPLPLPGEIVTAAVSRVTMRARESLGGGWATKNARCGKQGSMVSSQSWELGEVYVWGVHGPRVCELGPRAGRETG